MKNRNFIIAVFSIAIIAITVVCSSISQDAKRIKVFAKSDLEALAQEEVPGGYRYPNKEGKAVFCYLYIYTNIKTGAKLNFEDKQSDFDSSAEWKLETKQGLKDKCPNKGNGCNPYSCQEVPY